MGVKNKNQKMYKTVQFLFLVFYRYTPCGRQKCTEVCSFFYFLFFTFSHLVGEVDKNKKRETILKFKSLLIILFQSHNSFKFTIRIHNSNIKMSTILASNPAAALPVEDDHAIHQWLILPRNQSVSLAASNA